MTISDNHYSRLVNTLTDMHATCDHFAVMGRPWVENQVQVALCAADVYPASSEDGTTLEHAEKQSSLRRTNVS